jgi:hypothetical protein
VARKAAGRYPFDFITDCQPGNPNWGRRFGDTCFIGAYKIALGSVRSIAQVNTFSGCWENNYAKHNFVRYGSIAASDLGWNVGEASVFTPLIDLVTREAIGNYAGHSIRQSGGKPLGRYRWLVWALAPVAHDPGSNTSIKQLQVILAESE